MPTPAEQAVAVALGGREYRGWLSYDIDSDLMVHADAFELSARPPEPEVAVAFQPGARVEILVGGGRQLVGYVDDVAHTAEARSTSMILSGRDLGGWLMDVTTPALSLAGLTIKALAEKLIEGSGITEVTLSNVENARLLFGRAARNAALAEGRPVSDEAVGRAKTSPGERRGDVLKRECQRMGLLWWVGADGRLVIGKPNYSQQPTFAFYHYVRGNDTAKNNVLSAEVRRSGAERYSEVRVRGQRQASPEDDASAAGRMAAVAIDAEMASQGGHRVLEVTDLNVRTREQAERRAQYELQKRRLSGLVARYTVAGHGQGPMLYAVNTTARVIDQQAGLDGVYYVTGRRFLGDRREGPRTVVTLHEQGVLLP